MQFPLKIKLIEKDFEIIVYTPEEIPCNLQIDVIEQNTKSKNVFTPDSKGVELYYTGDGVMHARVRN